MLLGSHMSISGGHHRAAERGREATCDAIQIFTKNNMQWEARPIGPEEGQKFREACQKYEIQFAFGHTSYLINLGAVEEPTISRSLEALQDEIVRADILGLPFLVLHPGGHMGDGEEAGLARILQRLDQILEATSDSPVKIALETTAGQGTQPGSRWEHLGYFLQQSRFPDRLGVCVDTAHLYAAGYDIVAPKEYAKVMKELDHHVGRKNLLALHLNDSKTPLGSRVDRHAHIGEGSLGLEPFRSVLQDPRFRKLPMTIETPKGKGPEEDIANLAKLRSLIHS